MAPSFPLVVGVFQQEADAKNAMKALQEAGFTKEQIGLALREGGIVTHTLLNDLVKLGVPQDRATYYESQYTAGRPLVSVRADGREQEAAEILRSYGAEDQQTQRRYEQTRTEKTRGAGTASELDETQALRLREEQLQVQKQRVQTGEVHLHKEVLEEQQSLQVPVTHEEVTIERHALDGTQISETPIGQDEVIRVPVQAEQVQVTKTTMETGEVTIGKRAVQENQRVTETVRHEEARLEKDGDPRIQTNDDLLKP